TSLSPAAATGCVTTDSAAANCQLLNVTSKGESIASHRVPPYTRYRPLAPLLGYLSPAARLAGSMHGRQAIRSRIRKVGRNLIAEEKRFVTQADALTWSRAKPNPAK